MIVWSCGGGIQSVAIGVLIREGALPKPDWSGIADTGRECSSTWKYLDDVLNPYLAPVGVQVERIPHSLALVDLYNPDSGLTLKPAYTKTGRLPSYCSGAWKRDVFERWLRAKGVKEAEMWLGFSFDERDRRKPAHRDWLQPAWPLIDRFISREGCKILIEKAGLPLPKKSRCWMCPHMNNEEWREIKENPEEWDAAIALERQMNEMDPETSGLFLHKSRVPLELADLGSLKEEDGLFFRPCQESGCYT